MSQSSPVLPQRTLHEVLGTLLIGTWISTGVFAFELTQVWRYFTLRPISWRRTCARAPGGTNSCRRDPAWIPVMVLWMLAMDTTSVTAPHMLAYTWLVPGWGNISALQTDLFLLAVYGVAGAMCIFTMHMFLLSRYYTLCRRAFISAGLACIAFVSCALFITSASLAGTVYSNDRQRLKTLIGSWVICSVVTDWLIAGSLTWTLSRIRTTVDDKQGTIARIIQISILSGSIPTVLALLCLISFMSAPDTNYSLLFSQSLSSSGTLTVLFNLNSRNRLGSTAHSTTGADTTIHVTDTSVEPGQLFGGTVAGWTSDPACEAVAMKSLCNTRRHIAERVVAEDELAGVVRSDLGYHSKL